MKSFLNPEGHQNYISGSKYTVSLLKGLILPIAWWSFNWEGSAPAAWAAGLFLLKKIPHTGDKASLNRCGW